MNNLLQLGTASAKPGQKSWGQLHIREGRKKVSLAVCAIHGARPGEHVVLMANQHGQEVNGIESVRRFCKEVDPKKLRGTIFAIPSMNPFSTMARQQVWMEGDRPKPLKPGEDHYKNQYNMNWSWFGERRGLLVQAITSEVWRRAFCSPRKASFVIDLHCWEIEAAMYISNGNDPREMSLSFASGLRLLNLKGGDAPVATLYEACRKAGITNTSIELAGQQSFSSNAILEGVRLIRNMLCFRGLLPGKLVLPRQVLMVDPWSITNPANEGPGKTYVMIKARHEGIVIPHRWPFVRIRKGELISEVVDPQSFKVLQTVRAPVSGLLQQVNQVAARKGDRLALITLKYKFANPAKELRRLAKSTHFAGAASFGSK